MAMGSCGIQIGVASWPWEISFSLIEICHCLDGIDSEKNGQDRADAEAPDLGEPPVPSELAEKERDPDMGTMVQGMGKRKKGSSRHAITCIGCETEEDHAAPAGNHLQTNYDQKCDQAEGGEPASQIVEAIQQITQWIFRTCHYHPRTQARTGRPQSPGFACLTSLL